MDQRYAEPDLRDVLSVGDVLLQQACLHGVGVLVQAVAHADEDGCPHCAEAHRGRLYDQAHHHRRHRRESHGQQQRGDDGGCGAVARGSLDEGAEAPADDDRLNPAVGGDAVEAGFDGLHGPGGHHRGQQEQGSEDDVEHGAGDDQPLHGGRGDGGGCHVPAEPCDADGDHIAHGHGIFRRPAEAGQEKADRDDGGDGQHAVPGDGVHGALFLRGGLHHHVV